MIYGKIKDLCRINNTNIKQLEIAVGIANGAVARWKTSKPSCETVKKIADYFNVSTDFLIGDDDSQNRPAPVIENAASEPINEQQELIAIYKKLKKSNKQKLLAYSRGLLDGENEDSK